MKIPYITKRFSKTSFAIIACANDIIEEYASQGYVLTLRQLYYQFVARDLIANRQSEYKRLGSIIADGRLAGLIDWDAIEDRGRNTHSPTTWPDPPAIINACAEQYKLDLWEDQNYRPEVWIEKEALLSIVQTACEPYRVSYFACKGYVSQSAMWAAGAKRLYSYLANGQIPVIIHLGDHDPSGIDMTRDISERLELFVGESVNIRRIALNFNQIHQYKPPPNPAKITDSRFNNYATEYGEESWELDALVRCEERDRKVLSAIADNYDLVKKAVINKKRNK